MQKSQKMSISNATSQAWWTTSHNFPSPSFNPLLSLSPPNWWDGWMYGRNEMEPKSTSNRWQLPSLSSTPFNSLSSLIPFSSHSVNNLQFSTAIFLCYHLLLFSYVEMMMMMMTIWWHLKQCTPALLLRFHFIHLTFFSFIFMRIKSMITNDPLLFLFSFLQSSFYSPLFLD